MEAGAQFVLVFPWPNLYFAWCWHRSCSLEKYHLYSHIYDLRLFLLLACMVDLPRLKGRHSLSRSAQIWGLCTTFSQLQGTYLKLMDHLLTDLRCCSILLLQRLRWYLDLKCHTRFPPWQHHSNICVLFSTHLWAQLVIWYSRLLLICRLCTSSSLIFQPTSPGGSRMPCLQ